MTRSTPTTTHPANIPFADAVRVWALIGVLSFGGPAGQIALMHRELVERRRWISETRFLHALNYCMLLPGPEAQQLAIYIGWLMHRTWGGIVAGVLFVLPGALVVLALSMLYAHFQQAPTIAALFFGLKAAVLAIVTEAVIRVGRRALKSAFLVMMASVSFVAIFAFDAAFPWIVAAAAAVGAAAYRVNPTLFPQPQSQDSTTPADSVVDHLFATGQLDHAQPNLVRLLRTFAIWTTLWIAPIALLAARHGADSVFVQQGLFFSQTAVVTFGGAYAVLSYVAQRAVEDFMWLRPGEMLDGLALAETTPGPLILVLEFVAYLGAFRAPTGLPPMLAGALGAAIVLWVTFVPCFLWIFLGAPYVESLRNYRVLNAAMASITAAVVGVILNLSVWFALHTLFAEVHPVRWGPVQVNAPTLSSLNWSALTLTVAALIATLHFKLRMPIILAGCAALGVAWSLLSQ